MVISQWGALDINVAKVNNNSFKIPKEITLVLTNHSWNPHWYFCYTSLHPQRPLSLVKKLYHISLPGVAEGISGLHRRNWGSSDL